MRSLHSEIDSKKCLLGSWFCPDSDGDNSSTLAQPNVSGEHISLNVGDVEVALFKSVMEIPDDWDALLPETHLFLRRAFLKALEKAPPEHTTFEYLLFYHDQKPLGAALLQYFDFNTAHHIREQREWTEKTSPVELFKRALSRRLQYRVLICGNILLTGEYGFYFRPDTLNDAAIADLLERTLSWVSKDQAQAILIKDIPSLEENFIRQFESRNFHAVSFQPNMILDLREEWIDFDAYLASMTSKYRVRTRRAFKKASGLTHRELSFREVEAWEPQLYDLYLHIANRADFNMVALHKNYLSSLKKMFPEAFKVFAYFKKEELIGFFTTFQNELELEAHFLGFDAQKNHRHQLYLNMLYEIVRLGIDAGLDRVIFSRTAMEIKSSVGARAEEINILIRSNNAWFNRVIPYLIRLLEPKIEWKPRHPFGERIQ